jgi:hypothetical protein
MATTAIPPAGSTFGAALTWTQDEYGYLIHDVESFPFLPFPGGATQIAPGNGDRLGLIIINPSVSEVFVSISSKVSNLFGILLSANGGSLTMNVRQDMTLPTREWFGIAVGAPVNLYVLEIIGWKKFPKGSFSGTP